VIIDDSSPVPGGESAFHTTHWSVVLAAGHQHTSSAYQAEAYLCGTYWRPVYAFIRGRGYQPEDAEDLTQEFFARLLQDNFLEAADPAKGRFRSYLLAAVRNFLITEHRRAHCQKHGGAYKFVPLDTTAVEADLAEQTSGQLSPEKLFDRNWAYALLDRVLARLQAEEDASGKRGLFNRLKPALTGKQVMLGYPALAAEFNTTETALRMAVHRLRRRFGKLLRQEIAPAVAGRDEIEDELRHLLAALAEP
jgi:RNA polymerase sigma-70 factor (ECF subfamily)